MRVSTVILFVYMYCFAVCVQMASKGSKTEAVDANREHVNGIFHCFLASNNAIKRAQKHPKGEVFPAERKKKKKEEANVKKRIANRPKIIVQIMDFPVLVTYAVPSQSGGVASDLRRGIAADGNGRAGGSCEKTPAAE